MKKILILNNDLDLMTLLRKWLEIRGYQVKITSDKNEAVYLAASQQPHLIIADILQRESISMLRENKETSHIPILLMSGYAKGQENIHVSVDDVIEKPLNLLLLEHKMQQLFSPAA